MRATLATFLVALCLSFSIVACDDGNGPGADLPNNTDTGQVDINDGFVDDQFVDDTTTDDTVVPTDPCAQWRPLEGDWEATILTGSNEGDQFVFNIKPFEKLESGCCAETDDGPVSHVWGIIGLLTACGPDPGSDLACFHLDLSDGSLVIYGLALEDAIAGRVNE